MRHIAIILSALLALAACQDDFPVSAPDGSMEGMREIILQHPATQVVETRAAIDRDDRVENVILFAFNAQGDLLNAPAQQPVNDAGLSAENNQQYKVRAYLPGGTTQLYAVCNYDEPEKLIGNATNLQGLQAAKLTITNMEDAFKGVYVMTGKNEETINTDAEEDLTVTIPLTRLAAKQSFNIVFDPEEAGEEFKLSSIRVYNVPMYSYFLDHPGTTASNDTEHSYEYNWNTENYDMQEYYEKENQQYQSDDQLTDWTGDAVYNAQTDFRDGNYLSRTEGTELAFEKGTDAEGHACYTTSFNLYENRRGGVRATEMNTALDITERSPEEQAKVRQIYKKGLTNPENTEVGSLHQDSYEYASYIVIEGAYQKSANERYEAKYHVYLGCNNYGDFNVVRNHHYNYTVTIRACDDFDTRVTANPIGDPTLLASEAPFDAYFNAREAVLSSPAEWVMYVKDPDKTPWLEISSSRTYYAHGLGGNETPGQNLTANDYAQFRLEGSAGLHYLYIHTDEYVPQIAGEGANAFDNDAAKPRTGTICYARKDTPGTVFEYTVTQYPAQLVEIEAWNIPEAKKVKHRFYVSRFPEEKYMTWGFENHWNQTMDLLITQGLYDGLSTNRKEYVSALWGDKDSDTFDDLTGSPAPLELPGEQEACYREKDAPLRNLPTDMALGYSLDKNRDRNNNGLVDYNEILWYLPSLEQMEGIYAAMHPEQGNNPNLYGEYVTPTDAEGNSNGEPHYNPLSISGNFWTATPSVSDKFGITPGRAYYIDMNENKRAIGLRDQAFKVLVCRDANGWLGPDDAGGNGNVNNDETWNEDNNHNSPR